MVKRRIHSPRVDMHVHLGHSRDGAKLAWPEIQEMLDRYSISHAVMFPVDDVKPGPSYSYLNTQVADIMDKDKRIIGFCRLDPKQPEAASKELIRCLKRGMRGVKLHPRSEDFSPPEAENLIAEIEKEKVATVVLHTSHEHHCHPLPWERVFARFKKISFILAHAGKDAYREAAEVALRCPNVYLDTSTVSYQRTSFLLKKVGADKLVFASDMPYSHPAMELLKFDLVLENNNAMRKKIFEENPKKILGGF